jgi:hypothetical protein
LWDGLTGSVALAGWSQHSIFNRGATEELLRLSELRCCAYTHTRAFSRLGFTPGLDWFDRDSGAEIIMVTANELSSVDISRLQTPQLQPRGESAAQRNLPPPAGEDVRVSISAEARAAQESARTTAPVQGPEATTATEETTSANPVQAASNTDSLRTAESATATPAANAQEALADRANAVPANANAAAGVRDAEQAPDAASAVGRSATELYLENANRPDNQAPAPSGLRTSA